MGVLVVITLVAAPLAFDRRQSSMTFRRSQEGLDRRVVLFGLFRANGAWADVSTCDLRWRFYVAVGVTVSTEHLINSAIW